MNSQKISIFLLLSDVRGISAGTLSSIKCHYNLKNRCSALQLYWTGTDIHVPDTKHQNPIQSRRTVSYPKISWLLQGLCTPGHIFRAMNLHIHNICQSCLQIVQSFNQRQKCIEWYCSFYFFKTWVNFSMVLFQT